MAGRGVDGDRDTWIQLCCHGQRGGEGQGMQDGTPSGENIRLRAGEWFPHRPAHPDEEADPGHEVILMWDLILADFLATLPLED